MDDKYQCHICMELASKPVVTPCGHLFCWHCIYHWLRSNQEYLTCPICKSGLEMSSLRPIIDPSLPVDKGQNGIPPRPRPFRKAKPSHNNKQLPKSISNIGMNVQRGVLLAGYGVFPSTYMALGFQFKDPERNQSTFVERSTEYKLHGVVWKLTKIICLMLFFFILFITNECINELVTTPTIVYQKGQ